MPGGVGAGFSTLGARAVFLMFRCGLGEHGAGERVGLGRGGEARMHVDVCSSFE